MGDIVTERELHSAPIGGWRDTARRRLFRVFRRLFVVWIFLALVGYQAGQVVNSKNWAKDPVQVIFESTGATLRAGEFVALADVIAATGGMSELKGLAEAVWRRLPRDWKRNGADPQLSNVTLQDLHAVYLQNDYILISAADVANGHVQIGVALTQVGDDIDVRETRYRLYSAIRRTTSRTGRLSASVTLVGDLRGLRTRDELRSLIQQALADREGGPEIDVDSDGLLRARTTVRNWGRQTVEVLVHHSSAQQRFIVSSPRYDPAIARRLPLRLPAHDVQISTVK